HHADATYERRCRRAIELHRPDDTLRAKKGPPRMLYAILCYDSEQVVGAWTKEKDDQVMANLLEVQAKLSAQGKLGPVGRLQPTKTATTIRKGKAPVIMDGPFAETKEQLLG